MSQFPAFSPREVEGYKKRFTYLTFLTVAIFGTICLKLWFLQIIKGDEFRRVSENNRIRLEIIPPYRGEIYDRNGTLMADNRPSFNLCVMKEDVNDMDSLVERLNRLIGLDQLQIREMIYNEHNASNHSPFKPVVIKRDLGWDELSLIEMHKLDLPGVTIEVEPKRNYLFGEYVCHLIGYVGEINKQELESREFSRNKVGDFIGKVGIERKWQRYLMGIHGGRQMEVDAQGRVLGILQEIKPYAGDNLFLTINCDLQMAAYNLLKGKAGCIIAIDPRDGEILAMASSPTFDPNALARGIGISEWESLIHNPSHPFENKALQGQYPPGSIFKIITAAAALEEGIIASDTRFTCEGQLRYGDRIYKCWKERGHGTVDIHKALVESCDSFFYQVGDRLGIIRLARYARAFGLGMLTGIDLGNEKSGLIPTPKWKFEKYEAPWWEGETLSCAIGQGFLLVTPLQMVVITSAIANGGTIYRPQVVSRVEDVNGQVKMRFQPIKVGNLPVSQRNLLIVKEALFGVVNEPKGTGRAARSRKISTCGKTGTAQVIGLDKRGDEDEQDSPYLHRDHAWFIAYAPKDRSEIAVVVLIEHGGRGGTVAAPIAKEIVETYFKTEAKGCLTED